MFFDFCKIDRKCNCTGDVLLKKGETSKLDNYVRVTYLSFVALKIKSQSSDFQSVNVGCYMLKKNKKNKEACIEFS